MPSTKSVHSKASSQNLQVPSSPAPPLPPNANSGPKTPTIIQSPLDAINENDVVSGYLVSSSQQVPSSTSSQHDSLPPIPTTTSSTSSQQQLGGPPLSPSASSHQLDIVGSPTSPTSPTSGASGKTYSKRASSHSRSKRSSRLSRNDRTGTAEDLVEAYKEELKDTAREMRKLHSSSHANTDENSWMTIFSFHGTVIPHVIVPGIILTVWATMWTAVYMKSGFRSWATTTSLISIISFVLGLLLVFRTNTAYDRYWEGRRMWSALTTHIRNFCRAAWIGVNTKGDIKNENDKRGAVNLALGYAYAVKHYLRGEKSHKFNDMAHLLLHVPKYHPSHPDSDYNLPVDITIHLTDYVRRARAADLIDIQMQGAMNTALNGMLECLTAFERIRNSPIPLAYSIHLKHCLLIFLLSLPFQLVNVLYWATIPLVAIASFTLFGIESIAAEIENPFGYDANDLRMNEFTDSLRQELEGLMRGDDRRDVSLWDGVWLRSDSATSSFQMVGIGATGSTGRRH
ncbi:hypothetical protein HDU76_005230 [Blyttiomyces sp. JEL0837]|nr:hypothetical protein HDU76_005230 [Blyttiomyces sp. JEL0837]